MWLWNDISKNRGKKRQKLLSRKIQTSHTRDCPIVGDTCDMRGDSIMEFLLMDACRACFSFYHRIVDYSTHRVDETLLR